jgi:hypothetical protein
MVQLAPFTKSSVTAATVYLFAVRLTKNEELNLTELVLTKELSLLTHIRWSGTELAASKSQRIMRSRLIFVKFLALWTPISSQVLCLCALSTSDLVGEQRHCM